MGEDNKLCLSTNNAVHRSLKWLDDSTLTSAWTNRAELDLKKHLKEGGGFAKIQGFLPDEVAEGVRLVLEGIPKEEWEHTGSADRDDSKYADKVKHGFSIIDVEPNEVLLGVARVIAQLLPGFLPNVSAARYTQSDHIAPHDDIVPECYTQSELQRILEAYGRSGTSTSGQLGLQAASKHWRESSRTGAGDGDVNAQLEEALATGDLEAVKRLVEAGGRVGGADPEREIPYVRTVAMVYYLNRDWKAEYGGELVDMQENKRHLPDFNTFIAFEVPRMHEVTAVRAVEGCARYSIFGFYLVEDKKPPKRLKKRLATTTSGARTVPKKRRPVAKGR